DRTSAGGESQFAQVLGSANLLSADQMGQIDRGRGAQQTLSNAILHSGLVAEDVLASALARFANSSLVSLATAVTPAVAKQLPRRFCELRACVLIELSRTHATIAVADPLDEAALAEAQDMLGAVKLAVVTATLSEVREALKRADLPAVFTPGAAPSPFGPHAVPASPAKHTATPQPAAPSARRRSLPRPLVLAPAPTPSPRDSQSTPPRRSLPRRARGVVRSLARWSSPQRSCSSSPAPAVWWPRSSRIAPTWRSHAPTSPSSRAASRCAAPVRGT